MGRRTVIGHHGCSRADATKLLKGSPFRFSTKSYDWLGTGAYFWLDDPARAIAWARGAKRADPVVLRAELDLDLCLDMRHPEAQELYEQEFEYLREKAARLGLNPLVENTDVRGDPLCEKKLRNRDCLIINSLCERIEKLAGVALLAGEEPILPPFTSVFGVFQEGGPLAEGSGLHRDSHVQIAVRDVSCITGLTLIEAADAAAGPTSQAAARLASQRPAATDP